jgi:hypothetical protein
MRGLASNVAPAETCSVMLSASTMVPLTNVPAGSNTVPPPRVAQASTAC